MADAAIIVAAPAGTQRKSSQSNNWVTASVNDILGEGDEVQNTQGNSYTLSIYPEFGICYDELVQVELRSLSGTVKYKNSSSEWVTVTTDGNYSALAVGPESGGGVVVVCSRKGKAKAKPWST